MERIQSAYEGWINLPQPKKMRILRFITAISFFLFLFVLVIYLFSETRHMSKPIQKTVIFMEPMPYNLEAIRYYAQRRDVEISAIVLTLSGWVGNLNAAYENVASFLKLLYNEGYSKRVPLYYGNSVSEADFDFFEHFNASSAEASNTTACTYRRLLPDSLAFNAELIFGVNAYLRQIDVGEMAMHPSFFAEPLRAFLGENEASFLVLGPCTDAAWFLRAFDAARAKVTSVVIAGGNFLGEGDVQPVIARAARVERSFFFDPRAADYLLRGAHGRPVTLLPLDAAFPWRPAAFDGLIGDRVGDPAGGSAAIVAKALYGYHGLLEPGGARVPLALLAAAYAADAYLRQGARGWSIPVHVLPGNETLIGGLSVRPQSGSFDVKVVLELDAEKFFTHLMNVNSLALF